MSEQGPDIRRDRAIEAAVGCFDSGEFVARLSELVAHRTESQRGEAAEVLRSYLSDAISPILENMGFETTLFEGPHLGTPAMIGRRWESDDRPTVLVYGHGDVVSVLESDRWAPGLDPWKATTRYGKIYARGTADNKGQHLINFVALESVLKAKGSLGFNLIVLMEMGEEIGSPGLDKFVAENRDILKADIAISSDGPRYSQDRPTVFLGARGHRTFELSVTLREGGRHSGNWGGAIANPAIVLANAVSSLIDATGQTQVEGLQPAQVPSAYKAALDNLDPSVFGELREEKRSWGNPDLTLVEKLFAYSSCDLLAFSSGEIKSPVNAIPDSARAVMQIRYSTLIDGDSIVPLVRAHLDEKGFSDVEIVERTSRRRYASATDADHPYVLPVIKSLEATAGKPVDVLPSFGGALPNEIFTETLGIPSIWIPHSYARSGQHSVDEHLLEAVVRESLQVMTGLFFDIGEGIIVE